MIHSFASRILLLITVLLAGLAPVQASGPEPLYRVRLGAATREERSALTAAGYDVEAVGPGWVSVLVTREELTRLRATGPQGPYGHTLNVEPVDFPPSDAAYHNYAEVQAVLTETAAAHAGIVTVGSIGKTLEGREIPYAKISDNAGTQEADEPAVLFMALTHAREHLSVEMALAILRMFTEGYGVDPQITNLVDGREIYILPIVNPDGGEYDIASGIYRSWRKNRRPNGDGSYGVDLNRNFGYQWGCCGGSSGAPSSTTYRGPAAFSERETQAIRDFVLERPNLRAAISFHTYGELILYPYGYTYDDLPADMEFSDLTIMRTMAQTMAGTNGYTPQQASDLYITSGDVNDWLYGELGMWAFTFEMFPVSSEPGFYPPASDIERETERNLPAVLYLTRMADAREWTVLQRVYVPLVAK